AGFGPPSSAPPSSPSGSPTTSSASTSPPASPTPPNRTATNRSGPITTRSASITTHQGRGWGVLSPDPYPLRVIEAVRQGLVADQSGPADCDSGWPGEGMPHPRPLKQAQTLLAPTQKHLARPRGRA